MPTDVPLVMLNFTDQRQSGMQCCGVVVHLRKDRFPLMRRSKLKPRGAGPYKVLAKINDNAYSIDIPIAEFGGVSNSFNIADLSPYDGDDLGASRSTSFEGGDDEDIPTT
jgi:hypothetical protein